MQPLSARGERGKGFRGRTVGEAGYRSVLATKARELLGVLAQPADDAERQQQIGQAQQADQPDRRDEDGHDDTFLSSISLLEGPGRCGLAPARPQRRASAYPQATTL